MRRLPREPTYSCCFRGADEWMDQPGKGPFHQLALGVVLPLALLGYGGYGIAAQQITLSGRGSITPNGPNAVAFGIAWVSAGVVVH